MELKGMMAVGGPQAWPACDEDIKSFVVELVELLKQELEDRLTGIYLHGSLAMGSYYRPKSDIDLIVVVENKLEAALAGKVGVAIARKSENRPTTGNVELSIITAEAAKRVPIPVPFELHYSSTWHDRILNQEVDYSEERTDPDLASHLMYVWKRGIGLTGKPIPEVFGAVEWASFMDAVMDDFSWIIEEEHIVETPFYGVLNICRVLQLNSEDSRMVHSKDEGGEWGLTHLPELYHPLIRQALDIYRSTEPVSEEQRRTGGKDWDRQMLLDFRDYARSYFL
jgi:streptomycin 3"-adenylyltransferase